MVGIWEFPAIEEFRSFLIDGFERSRQQVVANFEAQGDEERAEIVRHIRLEDLVVVDEWGDGIAEIGGNTLRILGFFSLEGEENESTFPQFDPAVRTIRAQFNELVNFEVIEPPEPSFEWFPNIDIEPVGHDRFEDSVSLALGRGEGNRVFDLMRLEAIQFTEPPGPIRPGARPPPRPFSELPRVPLQALRERARREEEEEVEPEPEPEPEVEPEPEPITAEERIRRAIRQFQVDEQHTDIPAGKPTRRVDVRDLYDFELRMGLPSNILGELDDFAPGDQLTDGIGFAIQLGRVGRTEPSANFPRTSSYVKNYLTFEGPQYILALYRDLVFYSGFISGFYGMRLRAGKYPSFRGFMYRLHQIGERGGPTLVERLSQQQAAARGLETLPDHPTIDGAKAPWLEKRQYYQIVEDNTDHDAWNNPVEFLHQELGEIEQ